MSSQLICPLCEECLEEEGTHFLRHFKYKQYACHDDSCTLEFYTETDRNEHNKKTGHKRSFQKHINPYISKLVAMVASDARALATSSLDTVLENRFGVDPDISIINTPKPSSAEPSANGVVTKKRTLTDKTPSTIVKKKSTSSVTHKEKDKEASAKVVEETPRRPSGTTSSSTTSKDTPSSSSRPAASSEVDSTTNDHASPSLSTSTQKKTKKKRTTAEVAPSLDINEKTYDQMSATEKLAGFFDPNVPARRNAAKVKCADCKEEIVYDFILRKDHVSSRHMAADVAPEDYEDILKTAMDSAFPDLPNTNLACQLCMTAQDIARSRRREHIELHHTNSLPNLECPFLGCAKGYRRQCDLSGHMKDSHKAEMSRYKDAPFQKIRRHRNFMINEVLRKCFPWSELETLEKTEKKVDTSTDRSNQRPRTDSEQGVQPLGDYSLTTDIRVLERSINKTRRQPQYNFHGSSSDSSDDDEVQPDYSQDIIFIRESFNSEVAAKLSQRNVQIKQEVVEQPEEQVQQHGPNALLDDRMDLVEEVKEEEVSEEDKKDESSSQPNASNSYAFIRGWNFPPPLPQEIIEPQIVRSPFPDTYGAEERNRNNYNSGRQETHGPDSIRPASRDYHTRPPSSSSHYNRNSINNTSHYQYNRSGPPSRYQSNSFHSRVVMPPRIHSPSYRRSSRGRERSRSRPRNFRRN